MDHPIAYFLTWSCHGNWLHGDARGSVDRNHNTPGTPVLPPDAPRQCRERGALVSPPQQLSPDARRIVMDSIIAHCKHRGWTLHAVNVRSNHVHAIVQDAGIAPEKMMGEFKAWCSRRVREANIVSPDSRVWTQHGSTRYLWLEASVAPTVKYVMEMQDEPR